MLHSRKSIRELERASIRSFVEENDLIYGGTVLDYGAGDQPYKDLVDGEYTAFDPAYSTSEPAGEYDTILCTQVLQYVSAPEDTLRELWMLLKDGGFLVLTFPTLWEECEDTDKWRFTAQGMTKLLERNGFSVISCKKRATLEYEDFSLALGYGIVAKKHA